MKKQTFFSSPLIWLCFLALTGFIILARTNTAYGSKGYQITIPTRTPEPAPATNTPPSAPATNTPGSGGSGGGGEATPTSSTGGQVTPTVGPAPITVGPTPLGGYLPTAEPCGTTPTVRSLGTVFVREGPGTNYQALASMQYLEVRPIRGRAQNAEWWLIEMGDGTLGWVANLAVQVYGYTGLVPLLTPPALANGTTPTPGPLWNPTPNPICTVEPTATATTTPTITAAASPTATYTPEPTITDTPAPSPTTGLAPVNNEPTNTVPAAAETIIPTNVPPTPAITAQTLTPTAPSSPGDGETNSSNIALYAGLGLIITAGLVAISARFRQR